MKWANSVALASWLLKSFTFGRNHEALTGDLLEELRSARSATLYRRQALSAIGTGLLIKSRDYVLALVFSIACSTFYLVLHTGKTVEFPGLRILTSLSINLNVFFISVVGIRICLKTSETNPKI